MRRLAILLAFCLPAAVSSGQTAPATPPPAAAAAAPALATPLPLSQSDAHTKQLVEQVAAAYGGNAVARIRNVYDVVNMGKDGVLASLYIPPDRIWTKLEGPSQATMVVTSWTAFMQGPEFPSGAAMKMPEDKRDELLRRMDVDPLFILPRRFVSTTKFAPRPAKTVAGKTVEHLLVSSHGVETLWKIDPATGMLLGVVVGDTSIEYSDWRAVKGINVPYRRIMRKTGTPAQAFTVASCDINMDFDDVIFNEPRVWYDPKLDLEKTFNWYAVFSAYYHFYSYNSGYRYRYNSYSDYYDW